MLNFLMHNEIIEESNRLTEINNFSQSSVKLTQILLTLVKTLLLAEEQTQKGETFLNVWVTK